MSDSKSFEENLSELQSIIEKLESGDANLGECVELYKRGVEVTAICSKMLDEAKQQVKIISET